MKAAEANYLARVAALGCIVCRRLGHGATPAQIHHVRTGQGAAQRAPHWLTTPLCEPHHTGRDGIHGTRKSLLPLKADEMDLLAWTIEALNGESK